MHRHFQIIDSTQQHLISNYFDGIHLVSARSQLKGVGRMGNKWRHYDGSLAFSFRLSPSSPSTLTPIEIGVLIAQFLEKEYLVKIKLKWPNDLINREDKKCGGIICSYISPELIIAGVGLNWAPLPKESRFGSLFLNKLNDSEYQTIPQKIFDFLINTRLSADEIISEWQKRCIHLHQKVTIDDGSKKTKGIFTGLGKQGEAILDNQLRYISGSLTRH